MADKITSAALLAVSLILLAMWGFSELESSALSRDLAVAKSDLEQSRATNKTLNLAILRQNAAVADLGRAASDMQGAANKAVSEASKGRVAAERTARAILTAKPDGDLCAAADGVLGGAQ